MNPLAPGNNFSTRLLALRSAIPVVSFARLLIFLPSILVTSSECARPVLIQLSQIVACSKRLLFRIDDVLEILAAV